MKQLNFLFVFILFYSVCFAQRVTGYDNINNADEQNLVSVAQTLDDGTMLIAAIQRPLLYRGKGKMMLIRTDLNGNPLHHKVIELPDLSICLSGGIFKTDTNQYTIFCVFDTTAAYLYRTTHWGYIQTDTAFNVTAVVAMMPEYRKNVSQTDIKDIRVKYLKNGMFYGTLALVDNGRLLTPITVPEYTANITVDLSTQILSFKIDSSRIFYLSAQNRYVDLGGGFIPQDFLLVYDKYYLSLTGGYQSGGLATMSLIDSIYTYLSGLGVLPVMPDSIKALLSGQTDLFLRTFRSNIRLYKDSMLLLAGTGEYVYPTTPFEYLVDTNYKYLKNQSAIALIPINEKELRNGCNADCVSPPYRFTFVETTNPEYDMTVLGNRLRSCYYSSAFNQCLDFVDTNRIYFGRMLCDAERLISDFVSQSVLILTQFDSTLNKTWERYFFSNEREGIVSVNATKDGGCLLVTRRWAGMIEDTNYTRPVNRYEIAVYKYDKDGNYLGMNVVPVSGKEKKFNIYPNPANTSIQINSTEKIHTILATDMQGKTYTLQVSENNVNISSLAQGIYVLQLYDAKNNLLGTQKLVKE